jgi:hypothetical protein
MSVLLQQVVVAVLVIGCALFAAWRLSSVRLRLRALERLGGWPGLRRASWLVRLRERTRARELQACGGCAGATRGGSAPNRTPGALRR